MPFLHIPMLSILHANRSHSVSHVTKAPAQATAICASFWLLAKVFSNEQARWSCSAGPPVRVCHPCTAADPLCGASQQAYGFGGPF